MGWLSWHIKKRHAEKAAEANVDGLVLVTAGAGGHAGLKNPMAMISLIREFLIKQLFFLVAYQMKDMVSPSNGCWHCIYRYRFINTKESLAEQAYKDDH